ncbi:MAG: CpaF family protein [Bdellovibrionaceae bacterium]|nr:CpaF family protein [Pseudobdellovibrionaceae bacterium]
MIEQGGVFRETIRQALGPVITYLEDSTVTEILINGPEEVFVERKGKLERVPARFADEDSLRAAVNSIAQSVGRRITDEEPRLDARLPDGSRFAAVIPPCSRKGTTVSIRKFSKTKVTFAQYIQWGAITEDAARFLDVCMFLGKNIIVSGGTGSGKTTLLSLLCSRIPKGYRIIVIEDSSELQIDYEHVVFFETRMADAQGKGEVTIRDLLKSSLRLRPDRIIVGEVRAAEALELINAMNTGHAGSMGTVHANSPQDAIVRLEALAQSGDAKISEKALRSQVASAIDLIIQVNRFSDGSRKVSSIAEVRGFNPDGTYNVVPIFEIQKLSRRPDGKIDARIEPTGELPSFMQEIIDNNLPFPAAKFQKRVAS